MAQTGYTPISLYYSTTASAVPVNTNLANGELAINITDGKLYYKDNTGTVKVIAGAGGAGVAGGSNTQVQYNSSGSLAGSANFTFNGTTLTANTLNLTNALGTTYGGTGLTSFTANGVVYASSTSALATGSALTFDGTTFAQTGANGIPIRIQELTSVPTSQTAAYIGVSTSAFPGSNNGDLILAPRTSSANLIKFYTGSGTSAERYSIDGTGVSMWSVGGTEQMRLNSTGLGIGTSSPAFKLQVIGASNMQVNAAGTQQVLQLNNSDTTAGTQAVKLGFSSSGTTKSSINAAVYGNDYMTFNVGSDTERMRLDASGNLGIGTSSPAYKLDVSGEISNNIASSGELQNWRSGGVSVGNVWWDGSGQNFQISANKTGASLQLGSGAGVIKATLDSSGNLGLGVTPSAWTTSSTAKAFEIGTVGNALYGFSGSNLNVTSGAYYNSGWKYAVSGVAVTYYNQSSGLHQWYTAPSGTAGNAITFTQAMTLDASGQLGIGSTSPAAFVDVLKATYVDQYWRTGTVSMYLASSNSAAKGIFGTTTNHPLSFYTNGAEVARIDSSGNLLVGATAQINGERLSVVAGASNGVYFKNTSSANYTQLVWNSGTTGDNAFIAFGTEATYTGRGGITYNRAGGLVSYNVASDYRAKDIYGPVTNSGALIDSVPVYMGKMHGATQERPMFIAHETPAYAHTGEKDAVDEHGNPVYQQMDASTLIPVMWAELQSLRKRLADAGL